MSRILKVISQESKLYSFCRAFYLITVDKVWKPITSTVALDYANKLQVLVAIRVRIPSQGIIWSLRKQPLDFWEELTKEKKRGTTEYLSVPSY